MRYPIRIPCWTIPMKRVNALERMILDKFEFCWRHIWYIIKASFIYNGASIPKVLHWWEYSFALWLIVPSLIHDYFYCTHLVPRHEADLAFYYALVQSAYRHYPVVARRGWLKRIERCRLARKLIRARIMYEAVCAFGHPFWESAHEKHCDGKGDWIA